MENLFFPKRLGRLNYFFRIILLKIAFVAGLIYIGEQTESGFIAFLWFTQVGVFLYGAFYVCLPRMRDCGWPGWVIVFSLIPGIDYVFSILLLCSPSRVFFLNDPSKEEVVMVRPPSP